MYTNSIILTYIPSVKIVVSGIIMSNIKILNDFEPFNDMQNKYQNPNHLFVNCGYTSLLTVAKYYKKSIIPILINPILLYELYEYNKSTSIFRIKPVNTKSTKSMLNKIDIAENRMSPSTDTLLNNIINSINNGHPVSISIDLFYHPKWTEWYQKKHGTGHSFLVYGYDLANNIIYTVDSIKGYQKYLITIEDLLNCYNGLSDQYSSDSNPYTEYILMQEKENDDIARNKSHIANYVNNMLLYKKIIFKSLNCIKLLAKDFMKIEKNDVVIDWLNSTIYRRLSEHYKIDYLFKRNFELPNIYDKIDTIGFRVYSLWTSMRDIILKCLLLNKSNSEISEKSISLINEIYNNEYEYYKLLFSVIKKWK